MDTYNFFRMITCEQFPLKLLILNNRESRAANRRARRRRRLHLPLRWWENRMQPLTSSGHPNSTIRLGNYPGLEYGYGVSSNGLSNPTSG